MVSYLGFAKLRLYPAAGLSSPPGSSAIPCHPSGRSKETSALGDVQRYRPAGIAPSVSGRSCAGLIVAADGDGAPPMLLEPHPPNRLKPTSATTSTAAAAIANFAYAFTLETLRVGHEGRRCGFDGSSSRTASRRWS